MLDKFISLVQEGKWKGTEDELHDYLLYIKKYKPALFKRVKNNKDIKNLLKKFESLSEMKLNESGWANQKAMKRSDVVKILKTDLAIILSGGKPKGGYRGDTGEIFSWGDRSTKSGMSYTISVDTVEDILKELP
jgi:hypothetical protein